jgi:COMPASS component SWD1
VGEGATCAGMNKQLLDPFESDYPERIEEELQYGNLHARCCAFNRRGTLLATGCHEGAAILWDFDTRGVVKVLQDKDGGEPPSPIVAIGWSLNGRRVVTAEERGRIRLWDVSTGKLIFSTVLDSVSLTVHISPSDPDILLACPNAGVPLLICVSSGETKAISGSHTAEPSATATARKQGSEVQRNYSACFTNDGVHVYVGNGKGFVSLWNVKTLEQCGSFQLPSATAVRNIQVSRDGGYVLVSETGKIRVYDARQSTLYREFMDQVNRTQWRKCMFSADMSGNYVVGATAEKGEHAIHIWNRDNGQLILKLDGPKESIWDLAWHPSRTILATCGHSGKVLIWAKHYAENYSAFAPNFKELEENEEYMEREDEFDLVDQSTAVKKKLEEEEAVEVDITGVDDELGTSSCQLPEVEDELVYLPVVPDVDPDLAGSKVPESESSSPNILTRVFRDGQQVRVLHSKRFSACSGEPAVAPAASASEGSAQKKARV